jgi:hypothetical protein
MNAPGSVAAARLSRSIAGALLLITAAATAAAADGGAPRSGGLVPSPRKTREELIREWDLNSDGKIDQGEAEVAASRMRRERAELRLNSGIDPVTGRPRDEASEEGAEHDEQMPDPDADADMMLEEEPAEDDARGDADERPALPGTRVPRPRLPGAEKPAEKQDLNAGRKPAGAGSVDRLRRPVTGGTRAGGVPARAGYGSGVPSRPLNAGLPIVPKTRVVVPTPTPSPTQSRGGPVPPGRPSATVTRPATPAPPRPAASREVYNPY